MIYVICKPRDHPFFKDYLDSMQPYLPHEVIPSVDTLSDAHTYLFVLSIPDVFLSCTNIMYLNTEQLTKPIWRKQVQSYLDKGIRVLDYDLFQSRMLSSPLHHYLPCVYEPRLTELIKRTVPTYDIAFCSINSERRARMAHALAERGVRVMNIFKWGEERDVLIAQCRMLINVHYDEQYNIFEHLRCDRWVMAGLHVVSEPSLSDAMLDLADRITIVPYDRMVDTIVALLSSTPYHTVHHTDLIQARHQTCLAMAKEVNEKI